MPITTSTTLDQLLAVANSYHEPEARDSGHAGGPRWLPAHDHLDGADAALDFLGRNGIHVGQAPTSGHLARLREIRAAARALVDDRAAFERSTARLLSEVEFRLDADGHLHSRRQGWDGFIDSLLPALVELRDHADRLKLCDNDQCRWLFIDRSKNHSRQWCESASCGNRQRVRRFRERVGSAA